MFERPTDVITPSRSEVTNTFMHGVYGWMAAGLCASALMAYLTLTVPFIFRFVYSTAYTPLILALVAFGVAMALQGMLSKLSSFACAAMFFGYSALMGMVLSSVMLMYTAQSVFSVFISCAGMFAAMSIYGLVTKRDLTSMGSFMMMGLFGIIIAMVINIFVQSSMFQFGIDVIGVFIFLGLTAYDTQAIRNMGESAPMDDSLAIRRGTIQGALRLYLDFINLFLFLLRLFGSRR